MNVYGILKWLVSRPCKEMESTSDDKKLPGVPSEGSTKKRVSVKYTVLMDFAPASSSPGMSTANVPLPELEVPPMEKPQNGTHDSTGRRRATTLA